MQHSTDNLAKLILQRRQCLVQMRDLGRKQSKLIATGEMDALLRLLAAKQHVLGAMQSVEQNLAPYHEEDPEQRIWSSAELRAQTAHHRDDCNQLLAEVIQLEKTNEEQITIRRDEIRCQLHMANSASQARGAYQAQGAYQSQAAPAAANVKKPATGPHTKPHKTIHPTRPKPPGGHLDLRTGA